jgi:S1-C subfamily serine protease
MKKIVLGGLALAAAVVTVALLMTPGASAQQQDRNVTPRPGPFLTLEGLGSSIGVMLREQRAGDPEGVLIDRVEDGSPAMRAGVQAGDLVVEFDGERARSVRQFTRLVRETPPGRAVKMTVVRAGSKRTLDITPESNTNAFGRVEIDPDRVMRGFPRDFQFDLDIQPFGEGFGSTRRLGVRVTPISDQLASYFGVKEGVLVAEVEQNSPAASAGVKAGDVVTAVNGRNVASPSDLIREVREAQPGTAVDLRVMRERKETTLKVTLPDRRRPTAGTLPV